MFVWKSFHFRKNCWSPISPGMLSYAGSEDGCLQNMLVSVNKNKLLTPVIEITQIQKTCEGSEGMLRIVGLRLRKIVQLYVTNVKCIKKPSN